mmetsp:Transcript_26278/g.38943  ORF Transcript_26278/g.38943 Transcript_26278/m.38943 type:complete len:143 (+) Transcript_26278:393-821(+)
MYINSLGCDQYSDWPCNHPYRSGWVSTAYFVSFTTLSSLVLLTLFIGVVTTSMDEAREKQKHEQSIEDDIADLQKQEKLNSEEIDNYRSAFRILDLDGGGTIEEEELRIGLESIGKTPSDEELRAMMKEVSKLNTFTVITCL